MDTYDMISTRQLVHIGIDKYAAQNSKDAKEIAHIIHNRAKNLTLKTDPSNLHTGIEDIRGRIQKNTEEMIYAESPDEYSGAAMIVLHYLGQIGH